MADSTLQILIDVRAKLDELTKSQQALRDLGREATSTGQALKTGLGVEVAHRGLDFLTQSIQESVTEFLRMAGTIEDQSRNLEISTTAYQVLGNAIRDAGGDAEQLSQAVSNSNRSMVEART